MMLAPTGLLLGDFDTKYHRVCMTSSLQCRYLLLEPVPRRLVFVFLYASAAGFGTALQIHTLP